MPYPKNQYNFYPGIQSPSYRQPAGQGYRGYKGLQVGAMRGQVSGRQWTA